MKHKFRLMGRVGLTLVLALSLSLVMAVPVSAAVSQPTVTFASDAQAAPALADADFTIKFDSSVALTDLVDTITIEFPTGTTLGTIVGTVEGETIASYTVSGQRVSITVPSGADIIAEETVDVALTAGITNPADGDYTLKVYTSKEPTVVTSATYIISKPLTNVNQPTLTPTTAGAVATYAIPFTTTEGLRIGDAIVIEFSVDTDISAVVSGDVTGVTVASISIDGQVLTINLGGDLGAGAQTVTIANHIINPTTLLNPDPLTDLWKLTIYTTYGHRIPTLSVAYTLTAGTTISQIDWSTVDEYVPNATPSTAFKIETQTQYGNAAVVGASDVTFTLTASSGAFYSDAGCTTVITTIIIGDAESESAAFYYKGATGTVGTVTITADELVSQGWTMASTTILVNPKLELWGGGVKLGEYKTFALAIAAALPYDTIKVAASTYEEDFTVSGSYLTIESAAGAATTIIEGTVLLSGSADNLVLGGATGKGFTIKGTDPLICLMTGADNVEISYNTIDTGEGTFSRGITTNPGNVTGLTVSHNTFILTDAADQAVRSSVGDTITEWTITDNVFTGTYPTKADQSAIEIPELDITALDTTISGNTFTTVNNGVLIGAPSGGGLVTDAAPGKLEISGNTFDSCEYGIDLVNDSNADEDDQNVVITQNTFTSNKIGLAINYGDYPNATDYLDPEDFTVKFNDFSGNTYGIYNAADDNDPDLAAENNYWGSVTGPTITTNVGGTGDAVSAEVDYSPWLNASGGGSTLTDSITLVAGWNLISLPLIPTDATIETVLAGAGTGVTVNKVAYFTGGPAGSWLSWFPPPTPGNLTTMNDGKGYWIDVSAGGSLTLIGVALALPGYAPPTYDVVVGWNLIGFTSTAVQTVDVYLGSVLATVEAMYKYDAATGLYTAVVTGNNLASGEGYWLAVNAAGKIYP